MLAHPAALPKGLLPSCIVYVLDLFLISSRPIYIFIPPPLQIPYMPSWLCLLAQFHRIGPVFYLTPQFTRGVRFPRAYVLQNSDWNSQVIDALNGPKRQHGRSGHGIGLWSSTPFPPPMVSTTPPVPPPWVSVLFVHRPRSRVLDECLFVVDCS